VNSPLFFQHAPAFRQWLERHAASCSELFVSFHRVATGLPCMSYAESVDEALCFGWIDGLRRRVDEHRYLIRFTPRQASSIWSAVNIAKVQRLRVQRRMAPPGDKAFALRSAARSAIYAHEQASPADLSRGELRVFKRSPPAWKFFEAAPRGYRKRVLHWVTSAKRGETRASRLTRLVEACAVSQRLCERHRCICKPCSIAQ
jgi:uncharacterized protein YdeI (YjbR/CyaY-like superfamily)